MSFELYVTSVPKGIKPGSRGFSAVGFTEGMPANYVQFCESISGYVHIFTPEDSNYTKNPPAFSHLLATLGGRTFSILSRVGSCGIDYTGRTNKLAHHVMISPEERTASGPAVVMNHGKMFMEQWSGPPRFIPPNSIILQDQGVTSFKANTWEKMMGEADGAGVLAQSFLESPNKPAFILFQPGMDVLPLLAEAQALLPLSRRWDVTFNTYFTNLPVGMECAWRCCLPDSDALKVARRTAGVLIIDLPNKRIVGPRPSDTRLVDSARSGILVEPGRSIEPNNILKSAPESASSQRTPAARQPQRTQSTKIQVNYGDTLRPHAPNQAQHPKPTVGIFSVMFVLLILVIGLPLYWYLKHPAESTRLDAGKTGLDGLPTQNKDNIISPSNYTTSTNNNLSQNVGEVSHDAENIQSSLLKQDKKQPILNLPIEEIACPPLKKALILCELIKDKPILLPQGTNVILTFWGIDGNAIKSELKNIVGDESYVGKEPNAILARIKKAASEKKLSDLNPMVQFIEIQENLTNTLYIIRPIDASVELCSNGNYRIPLPQNGAGKKLLEYLTETKETEFNIEGERGESAIPEKLSLNLTSLKNNAEIIVRLNDKSPIIAEKLELQNKIYNISTEINAINMHEIAISNCIKTLVDSVRGIDNTKDKSDKEKTAAYNKLQKDLIDTFEIYLAHTNIVVTPNSPVRMINSFKQDYLNKAKERMIKKKSFSTEMSIKEFTCNYDQNGIKSFSLLINFIDEEETIYVAKTLCEETKLLRNRLKDLCTAKKYNEINKNDLDLKLSKFHMLRLKIMILYRKTVIIKMDTLIQ